MKKFDRYYIFKKKYQKYNYIKEILMEEKY